MNSKVKSKRKHREANDKQKADQTEGGGKHASTSGTCPTPAEAEWATWVWGTVESREKAREVLRAFEESRRADLLQLQPHQAEMVCQYWALMSMGILKPEEEEVQEAWGQWYWNDGQWSQTWDGDENLEVQFKGAFRHGEQVKHRPRKCGNRGAVAICRKEGKAQGGKQRTPRVR